MSLDLTKLEVAYSTEFYAVMINREDIDLPYLVVNKQHNVVDSKEENLPQALIIAKQFSILLEGDTWAKQVDEMYGREAPKASLYPVQ